MSDVPLLKPLHDDTTLSRTKLAAFERMDSHEIRKSLEPGQECCLKTRVDGTMLDGHHRVYVLRGRGFDVNSLPREIL